MDGTRIDEIADGIYRISTWLPAAVGDRGISIDRFLVLGEEPLLFHTGRRRRRRGGAGRDRSRRAARTAALAVVRPRRGRRVRRHERDAGRGPAPGGGVRGPGLHDLGRRPGRPAAPPAGPGRRRRPGRAPAGDGADAARAAQPGGAGALRGDHRHPAVRRPVHPAGRRSAGRGGPVWSSRRSTPRTCCASAAPGEALPQALDHLAELGPRTLATMHGSSFEGDGGAALLQLAGAWRARSRDGERLPRSPSRDRREADTPSGHG